MRARTINNLKLDRVHIGHPAAEAVLIEAKQRNADKVVVVVPQIIVDNTPIVKPITDALGERLVGVYTDLVDHVPRDAVFRLVEYLEQHDTDLVITIGGGTPMDTVKVALVCLAEGARDGDTLGKLAISVVDDGTRVTPEIGSPPFRQIIVPTTLSGAEFSDLAGCVDPETQVKQLFTSEEMGSASVILDPALTVYTPENLWLSTGIRAVDHAVESLCSSSPEPAADAGALHALRLLSRSLPLNVSEPKNLDARLDSQISIWLACAGLNRVPYGASHGIGHQLGAVSGVPHGYTSCVMLPHVMAFNEQATSEAQQLIADAMGRRDDQASKVIADLITNLNMPTRLRNVGVEREHFQAIADGSMLNAFVRANPRPIESPQQIIELLEQAY